ncbi:hypothetical protein J6590_074720 [Homalodisca vitripennis]|nr:hypothetical protein J6590_074720 [Homalodisca vitripennis]
MALMALPLITDGRTVCCLTPDPKGTRTESPLRKTGTVISYIFKSTSKDVSEILPTYSAQTSLTLVKNSGGPSLSAMNKIHESMAAYVDLEKQTLFPVETKLGHTPNYTDVLSRITPSTSRHFLARDLAIYNPLNTSHRLEDELDETVKSLYTVKLTTRHIIPHEHTTTLLINWFSARCALADFGGPWAALTLPTTSLPPPPLQHVQHSCSNCARGEGVLDEDQDTSQGY